MSLMNAQTGLQMLRRKAVEGSNVADLTTARPRFNLDQQHNGRSGQLGSFWLQHMHLVVLW